MLAMAALISISTEEVIDNAANNDNEKVEIKLSAGVIGVSTKAPLSNTGTFKLVLLGGESETLIDDWTATTA